VIADHHGSQLTVHDAHDRSHAALIGIGDRFEADQKFDTFLESHSVFVALTQAVEELVG